MIFPLDFIFDILKWWSRIRRWPRTLGFGVQSPWAYNYIRYVIAEHDPYYAYETLQQKYGSALPDDRQLAQLYFRIANHSQARRWGFALDHYGMKTDYVKCGCNCTDVVDIVDGHVSHDVSDYDVLVMSLESDWPTVFESFASSAKTHSLLIVEDIHRTRYAQKRWHRIHTDARCGITFDLYDCGLVFFDFTKHKQHYAVNY